MFAVAEMMRDAVVYLYNNVPDAVIKNGLGRKSLMNC